jgi:hypothetical protein
VLRSRKRPDGSIEVYRPKFEPGHYAVPDTELAGFRTWARYGITYDEQRKAHDGALRDWAERARVERDGKQWVLVQSNGYEYAVELAIDALGVVCDAVAVLPKRAWEQQRQTTLLLSFRNASLNEPARQTGAHIVSVREKLTCKARVGSPKIRRASTGSIPAAVKQTRAGCSSSLPADRRAT